MKRFALAAASATLLGCGLQGGGLGEAFDLGDSTPAPIDSALDGLHADLGSDAGDEGAIDLDASDAGPEADVAIDADGDAGCPSLAITDACKAIPSLVVSQVLDGADDDFVCVPRTSFSIATATITVPSPAPTLPEIVHMSAAWTTDGLAIHVRVEDPTIVVVPVSDANLYDADAIEVYVAGTGTLTGTYDGTNDPGAMQIVVTPESGAIPARAKIYQLTDMGPLDPSYFATKHTTDGWAVELALPWSLLHGAGVVGAKVGLDVAIDVDDDPARPTTRAVWAAWQQKSVPGKSSCAGTPTSWAWCDDRSWCTPALE